MHQYFLMMQKVQQKYKILKIHNY